MMSPPLTHWQCGCTLFSNAVHTTKFDRFAYALLLLAMSAFSFVWIAAVLIGGHFRHSTRGDGRLITPESDPIEYWCTLAGLFLFGALTAWRGLFHLRIHLKKRSRSAGQKT